MGIINQHMPLIKKVARQVNRTAPQSISLEDLEQEGAAKLLSIADVSVWGDGLIAVTLRNSMQDFIRWQCKNRYTKRSGIRDCSDFILDNIESKGSDPLQILLKKERCELAIKAISHLTTKQRKVLKMKWLDGMKLPAIGEVLKLTGARISQINKSAIDAMNLEVSN